MEVLLLGTGSADGWPNPWCRCASCTWARDTGTLRSTTAALVDRVLLIDCGPDAPRQADRAGVSLADVRCLLLTHAHPDHLAPAALLARSWSGAVAPLRVLGPASAIEACRHWVGPQDPVTLEVVEPGSTVHVDGYVVRALAAAHDVGRDDLTRDALVFDVTAPDGRRLLHATDTGPLAAATMSAVSGAAYDVVLLEETFGRKTDHGTGHLDLTTFPAQLAALRECGAVVAATDVVAVHLSHHNPPGGELARVLTSWGARVVDDLTVLSTGAVPSRSSWPRRQLVLGGARSGKSREAERRLRARVSVRYVATGGERPDDAEWRARVALHRARRPSTWTTVETPDVAGELATVGPDDAVLVDCVGLWLAGRLDAARTWGAEPGTPAYAESLAAVHRAVDDLVAAVAATRAHVVLVSNEVGAGVVPEHASGRLFRDLLGALNARLAAVCDDVDLVVAGRVVPL
ncbi:MAG: bifunctional adenosylcobinamide kinase/adenosylcobinamide-phosphate guanylyltransferase [Actinomycetales bacterium]|nr:bifunctional adenosylcobinamide kinase/adenosylcobinamide-phosphate guanylyltransferase [Actinomycetales bacterium]